MEFLAFLDGRLIIDRPILRKRRQLIIIQNARNDALRDDPMALEIHDDSRQHVQALHVQNLERFEAGEVVVGLGPGGVVLLGGEVAVGLEEVDCEREEDVVVDEDLRDQGVVRVQRGQVAVYDGLGAFGGCVEEVVVHFVEGAVALDSLEELVLWEVFYYLEFFVPVADSFGVDSVERLEGGALFFRFWEVFDGLD